MNHKQSGRVVAGVSSTRWKRFFKTAISMSLMNVAAWALGYLAFILVTHESLLGKGGGALAAIGSVVLFGSSWLMLRDRVSPEPIVEPSARVTTADERIEDILKKLPEGYMAFHHVPFRFGEGRRAVSSIEHVVVGPAGIFVIDTKSEKGKVNVTDDDQVLLDDQPLSHHTTSRLNTQIDYLKQLLAPDTEPTFINGLIVFTRAMVLIRKPVNNLHYMNKGYLLQHIDNQERINKWSDEEVQRWQRALWKIQNRRVI